MGRQEDLDAAYAEKYVESFVEADRRNRGSEPYTVAGSGGERVLVTWGDIKAIMDKRLHVGQISSRQGDGSRPYAVFSKRECAAEIAEMVNRRFNSTMGEK